MPDRTARSRQPHSLKPQFQPQPARTGRLAPMTSTAPS